MPILIRRFSGSVVRQTRSALAKMTFPSVNSGKAVDLKEFLANPEIKFIRDVFDKHGFKLKIAGGAVRDLVAGLEPNDVDFATEALPNEMTDFLSKYENVRLITHKHGLEHGTVSALINRKRMFEITTLRVDKTTDGRRAEVEFIKDWQLDALRRDFTINSMFMDFDGNVIDYYNGQEDLKNGRLLFVGDAKRRIEEDYLRIIRYFRFFMRFGKSHDSDTIKALKEKKEGLSNISGERIWSELTKILTHVNSTKVIPMMLGELDFGQYFGLDADADIQEYEKAHERLFRRPDIPFNASTLLASLIKDEMALNKASARLRLSNLDNDAILYIITNRSRIDEPDIDRFKRQLALIPASYQSNVRAYMSEFAKYKGFHEIIDIVSKWNVPKFPLSGDTAYQKVRDPRKTGFVIREARKRWAYSNFTLTENDLVNQLDDIISCVNASQDDTTAGGGDTGKRGQPERLNIKRRRQAVDDL